MLASGTKRAARQLDLFLQRRVFLGVEAIVARPFAIDAGAQDRLQRLAEGLGAGDEAATLCSSRTFQSM